MKLNIVANSERGKSIAKSGDRHIEVVVNNEKREQIARLFICLDKEGRPRLDLDYYGSKVSKIMLPSAFDLEDIPM